MVDNDKTVLYTVDDIQKIFKLGRTKAYQLMISDGFPSIRLNRRLYVQKEKLDAWINQNSGKQFLY